MTIGFRVQSAGSVVRMTGELDLASRDEAFEACCACAGDVVVLDLSQLTFMDGSGYRSIVAARQVLEAQGRTLTMRGVVGEPARLVRLIAGTDAAVHRPALLSTGRG